MTVRAGGAEQEYSLGADRNVALAMALHVYSQ